MMTVGYDDDGFVDTFDSSLGLEPRRQRNEAVDIFVDLGATLEDHDEVMNNEASNSLLINLLHRPEMKRISLCSLGGRKAHCLSSENSMNTQKDC